jgi:hypothetical protein
MFNRIRQILPLSVVLVGLAGIPLPSSAIEPDVVTVTVSPNANPVAGQGSVVFIPSYANSNVIYTTSGQPMAVVSPAPVARQYYIPGPNDYALHGYARKEGKLKEETGPFNLNSKATERRILKDIKNSNFEAPGTGEHPQSVY